MERRTFLTLCAACLGLTACTSESPGPSPTSAPEPPDDPDAEVRAVVASSELALIAAYRSAIDRFPDLRLHLEPLMAHHDAHLTRVDPGAATGSPLGSAVPGETTSSSTPDEQGASRPIAPSRGSSGSANGPSVPPSAPDGTQASGSRTDVLRGLAEAEHRATEQRTTACDGATNAVLARDLCLIAASEAQHATVLDGLAERAGSA